MFKYVFFLQNFSAIHQNPDPTTQIIAEPCGKRIRIRHPSTGFATLVPVFPSLSWSDFSKVWIRTAVQIMKGTEFHILRKNFIWNRLWFLNHF